MGIKRHKPEEIVISRSHSSFAYNSLSSVKVNASPRNQVNQYISVLYGPPSDGMLCCLFRHGSTMEACGTGKPFHIAEICVATHHTWIRKAE